MEQEFGFLDNLMSQMMWKISKMIKRSRGDAYTHTFTEEITGLYKAEFMQAIR